VTNKYYDAYKAVFDRVKADLEAVSSIKAVVLGEQFRLTDLPLAIINPEPTEISQATFGSMLDNKIGISIVLMIRETVPSNWFTDIISVMGDAMDKILSDRTLNNTVRDVIPTVFGPGEIRTQNKLFYGGVLKFQALTFFTP
jgi:hypothetical protein